MSRCNYFEVIYEMSNLDACDVDTGYSLQFSIN